MKAWKYQGKSRALAATRKKNVGPACNAIEALLICVQSWAAILPLGTRIREESLNMSANINRSNIAINSVELKGLIDKTLEYRERGHNQHAKFYAHLTMQVARVIDNWAKEPMQVGQWRA